MKEPLRINRELKNVFKINIVQLEFKFKISEWCDLNTRLSIPKTDTLPTALHSDQCNMVTKIGFEPITYEL